MWTLIIVCCVIVASNAENDGWVWKDKDQPNEKRLDETRYLVNENLEDLDERPLIGFRPQNGGPYGPNSRPIVPPSYPANNGVLVGPGGPTGIVKRPPYNGGIDDGSFDGGYVPPWIRNDPRYRDLDVCRCRYSFNCPSTGLKFGSCSNEKKYCCFSSKKYPALVNGPSGGGGGGGYYPPNQSYPNKYGPASFVQSPNYNYGNRRPPGNFNAGNRYPPGNNQYPGNNYNQYPGNNYNQYPGNNYNQYPGNNYNQNPGNNYNQYHRPQGNGYGQNYDYEDYDFYSRSLKKNETETSSDEKA